MRRRTGLTHGLGRSLGAAVMLFGAVVIASAADDGKLHLRLRSRIEDPQAHVYRVVEKAAAWASKETAFIVCDMWDLHHCLNAVRRETEMAPRMEQVLKAARAQGVVIIHAPSDCMATYKDHPARKRALETPRAPNLPREIAQWCRQVPNEEKGAYPIDQTDGGEDDDPAEHTKWEERLAAMGRNPKAPWKSETDLLTIDEKADYLSDSGEEIWSILEERGVKNVVLMGVHLNMCVLGRPFGLRQMARNGKNAVLMRDLTDTMYNPKRAPYVSHFAGTDLMVEHVEKFVGPSITSDQLLEGAPFRYKDDRRSHVAFVIAEDEYKTEVSLPSFAAAHLPAKSFHVSYAFGPEGDLSDIPGAGILNAADVAVLSVRRRVLPKAQLDVVRKFVADGKSVVGLRTASHAFAPRGNDPVPPGHDAWPEFDAQVLGGNYHGHHGSGPPVVVSTTEGASTHPILHGVDASKLLGNGSLYKVSPLALSAQPLLAGSIPNQGAEPVAWVNAPAARNRVFYTSLGQIDDFQEPEFNRLLRNAIDWAAGRDESPRKDLK